MLERGLRGILALTLAGLALVAAFAGGCGEAREVPRSSAPETTPPSSAGPAALVFTAPG